jgi:DNA-binding transcriptional regulator YiaG
MTIDREDRPYADLPGVTLRGVEVRRCPKCGEYEVVFQSLDRLHQVLAAAIVAKRTQLVRQERHFLRNFLCWTEEELAQHMGVAPEAVVGWERSDEVIGPVADRLLRLLAARRLPHGHELSDEMLRHISEDTTPLQVEVKAERDGWSEAA